MFSRQAIKASPSIVTENTDLKNAKKSLPL